jgi:hypothetical protein
MHRHACLLLFGFVLLSPAAILAQQAPPPVAAPVEPDSIDARVTRERFQQLLRRLPPSVGEVLQRDPSLLSRPDYLAPYPTLVAYLQQHPEITRNPGFFLGAFQYYERQPRDVAIEMFQIVGAGAAVLTAGVALLSVFVWLVRAVIDHRRWLRLSKVQAEVHTKVMDRLSSNEELMAYVQSPAGRRFLESAPLELDGAPRRQGAPVTSILWSLQGGVILLSLGVGMWFLQGRVMPEVSEGFFVIGVIAAALGTGFIGSSLMAYVISSRLGLVPRAGADRA